MGAVIYKSVMERRKSSPILVDYVHYNRMVEMVGAGAIPNLSKGVCLAIDIAWRLWKDGTPLVANDPQSETGNDVS